MADDLRLDFELHARKLKKQIREFGYTGEEHYFDPARPMYPQQWTCANFHIDPDTSGEYLNRSSLTTCEICGRPRPS
jgi:hypothetical protein